MSSTSQFRLNDGERNIDPVIITQASQPQPSLAPVNYSSFDPFSLLFAILPVLVVGMFVAILGLFAYTIIQGISTAAYNNQQPIISRDAKTVSKRQNVSGGADTHKLGRI